MKRELLLAASIGVASLAHTAANAGEYDDALRLLATTTLTEWANHALVTDALRAQNTANADLDEAAIIALDNVWRDEVGTSNSPMVDEVLSRPVSEYLKAVQDEAGDVVTEIFVMDNHGLNVGQSAMTSDYWQGDEAKWQETFGAGVDAIHISDVEFDESTQTYQVQLSMSLADPDSHDVIGAVTFGIDVGLLE